MAPAALDGRAGQGGVWAALRAFRPFGRPYWPQLGGATTLLVVAGAAQTASIFIFGKFTDTVLAAGHLDAFWRYAALWAALAVLGAGASFAGGYLSTWVSEHVVLKLRDYTFAQVQRLPPAEVASYRPGDLLARLSSDVDAVEQLASSGLVQALTDVVSALFFAVAAFWVRWDLALAVCALAPLFLLAARSLSSRIAMATRAERASNAALTGTIQEALDTLTRAATQGRHARSPAAIRPPAASPGIALHEAGRIWLRAGLREARVAQAYAPLWEIIETACILAILGMGAWEISAGRLTIGGLLAFAGFLGYLYPSLQSLGGLAVDAAAAAAAAERLRQLWPSPPG
jgi:ATP-binding cassette, subfamily B, bacterial